MFVRRLAPLAKCGLKTRLELVWRQASDDDPFATAGGAGNDFQPRTWYVENTGEESQQCGVGRAVDRWRGYANLKGAVRQPINR